jgi:cytoskeletal protein RodZ
MEGLGQKLQQARVARGLTLDEAGRLTKIRPGRLAEIEAEDFSNFASLAYAKGFLQIYGKFLDVDVTPYLEAFETPDQVTVDGYSYLQDNPAPKPTRPVAVRKEPRAERGSLLPFLIGVIVLVLGFTLLKFFLDVQRIKPRNDRAVSGASPAPAATAPPPQQIVAPRALPAENTPATAAKGATAAPAQNAVTTSTATTTPAVAAATTTPATTASEPEVRRAEPVHPDDLKTAEAESSPAAAASPAAVNRIEIRPLRKTYVKVVVNGDTENPVIERWVSAADSPLKVSGQRVAIRVLDPAAVEIRKNGKRVADDDADVTVE